jgi:NTE family protein
VTAGSGATSALILSGGGADGAYEVGVIRALAAGRCPATGFEPFEPAILSGTSIGSFNAAVLVGEAEETLEEAVEGLARLWLDALAEGSPECGGGGFRVRADPERFLDLRCYARAPVHTLRRLMEDAGSLSWTGALGAARLFAGDRPLRQRVLQLLDLSSLVSRAGFERVVRVRVSYPAIRASDKRLLVAATNWASGALRIFENRHMTDEVGPRILMGSSALPGIFRPVGVSGQPYVDGSVLANTPLKPALAAGADELHIVYLDPDVSNIPLERIESLPEALYRTQLISWAAVVNRDIREARSVNDGLEVLRGGGREGSPGLLRLAGKLSDTGTGLERYRPVTIHRYHPRRDLGGAFGLLDLRRDRLEELIRRGFEDAVAHDCADSGCVILH